MPELNEVVEQTVLAVLQGIVPNKTEQGSLVQAGVPSWWEERSLFSLLAEGDFIDPFLDSFSREISMELAINGFSEFDPRKLRAALYDRRPPRERLFPMTVREFISFVTSRILDKPDAPSQTLEGKPAKSPIGVHISDVNGTITIRRDVLAGAGVSTRSMNVGSIGSIVITQIEREANTSVVRVFYATDREPKEHSKLGLRFKANRSNAELHYGECHISIPVTHKVGHLDSPSVLKLEFRPNPERHIVLHHVDSLEEETFFTRVADVVSKSETREAFIFVHGYNVTFEDAARRTGQFAFDLQFVGAPILYSWPANGRVLDYPADEANVIWTAPHLERFLTLLAQHSGAKRIHVIAHSMGNRAVCDALKALSYRQPKNANVLLHHLVLAAPDIDADTFRELTAALKAMAGRITLYASSNDKAIKLSCKLHKNLRAGSPPPIVVAGIESIDASEMGTDFLRHSYFSDNWPLLADIHEILTDDKPASKRFGLRQATCPDGTFYVFRA
ncbi:MAG TPA: alpha/beta hydrolase [Bryobacteraceae bacterium]|jgi:esterase/lipase superfamily enzyme|nr:alpha/beta hydrolase [Bryobacteraceae bacterium]